MRMSTAFSVCDSYWSNFPFRPVSLAADAFSARLSFPPCVPIVRNGTKQNAKMEQAVENQKVAA